MSSNHDSSSESEARDRNLRQRWRSLLRTPRRLATTWVIANWWGRVALAIDGALIVISLVQLGTLAAAFSLRMTYPFELEWMEGGVVDHVGRVMAGEPLYQAPSVSFTPFLYTPFYYAVSAVFGQALGAGLLGPRLVSVVATAGSLLLIASFVQRESRDSVAAVVACGWFAATYALTGFWFDIARVDALFLLLMLAAVWLARFGRSVPAAVGAGAAIFLAFFTKQAGLAFLAPVIIFAWGRGGKRALITTSASLLPMAVAVAWANRTSDGWFGYYVFEVPGQHQVLWGRWLEHLSSFFFEPVAVLVLLSLLLFVAQPAFLRPRRKWMAYLVWLLAAATSSYVALLHRDGFVNVLIPFYAVLAVVAAMGFAWIRQRAVSGLHSLPAKLGVLASLAWFFAFGVIDYELDRAVPTNADRRAGEAMLDVLRDQPEPMWMPGTGYFASKTGHDQGGAHTMALVDIFKTQEAQPKSALRASILASIQERRWAVVILDPSFVLLPPEVTQSVRRHYQLQRRVYPEEAAHHGWPRTGFRSRPEEVWVPRSPSACSEP